MNNLIFITQKIELPYKIDAEKFAINYFYSLGYDKVIKTSEIKSLYDELDFIFKDELITDINGRPDLIAFNNENKIPMLIEVKTNGDGLRQEQIEWTERHSHLKITIFYLKQEINKEQKSLNLERPTYLKQRNACWYLLNRELKITEKEIGNKMEQLTGIRVAQNTINDGINHIENENKHRD